MKIIKFKKLNPNAVMPSRAYKTDAGFDLTAVTRHFEGDCYIFGTGIAVEIPQNHVGLIFPRSSVSKTNMILANCVGVIDSGYRGEIMLKFKALANHPNLYTGGEKIGQLIILPYPQFKFKEVDELSSTDRGAGGFGSTGK